jgi:hypothetical protein
MTRDAHGCLLRARASMKERASMMQSFAASEMFVGGDVRLNLIADAVDAMRWIAGMCHNRS